MRTTFLVTVCGLALLPCSEAQIRSATADQMRAGFLYQLAQYADWPPDSFSSGKTPLRFCVLGQDDLVEILESTVRGKTIQGRPIVIARAKDMTQVAECHLAFLGLNRPKQLQETFARWSYPPVLLVGEAEEFARSGGMVNLSLSGGKVTFEVNLAAAERARLEFRSQLLRFARIAGGKRRGAR